MDGARKLLIINLGSASTKVGIHASGKMVVSEELKDFKTIFDQYSLAEKRNSVDTGKDPGENEMDALAAGALRYFGGKEALPSY